MNLETVKWLNEIPEDPAVEHFKACCGSEFWARKMASARPFADAAAVLHATRVVFDAMPISAWVQAFESHPRIGDLESMRMKHTGNDRWSADEQSGAAQADEQMLQRLADRNKEYEQRFGKTFIVCATGKSAAEMLELLEERLTNKPAEEFEIASQEQRKITMLRLEKLSPPTTKPL